MTTAGRFVESPLSVAREAIASARSQPMASLLTIVMVAGMCVAVLLTTGQTAAAERAALAQIDAVGTRSVVVRADPASGLSVAIIHRLLTIDAVETVAGFGPIVDAHNAAVPRGLKVATRRAYGTIGNLLMTPSHTSTTEERALASTIAARRLGLRDGVGDLATDDGRGVVVVGELRVPTHLAFLEPLVVVPSSATDDAAPLTVLVVFADTSQQVAIVESTVRGLLTGVDPTKIRVDTSTELAAIRAAVHGQLGTYGRSLVLVILAGAALLVAVNNLALVTLRRRDFGRRRALGATRSLIVALMLTQVAMLAAIGAVIGITGALAGLAATGSPAPGGTFTLGVAVAAVLTAAVAALAPAIIASRRDPLHELRLP